MGRPRVREEPALATTDKMIRDNPDRPVYVSNTAVGYPSKLGLQEYMPHSERTNTVFRQNMTFQGGLLHPSDTPGLGVEIDEDEAAKYDYENAYLPYNRLADGTVHDW